MKRLVGLLMLLSACGRPAAKAPVMPQLDGPVATRTTPDAEFRATAPLARTGAPFTPPKIVERKLKNGIRVLFIERHDVPVVALRVVSDRGADQADPGIAEFWERAALRASEAYPSYEILEAWNDLGADYRAHASSDSSEFEVRVVSKLLTPAAKLLGEVTARPSFPTNQVSLVRERMRVVVSNQWDQVGGQLRLAIHEQFFPATHPYRHPFAPPESIAKVQGGLLAAYQKFAFTPDHVTIAVAGDTTIDELINALEPAFGGMIGPKIGPQPPPKAPADPPDDPRIIVVQREGSSQATIAAVWLGPSREIEDLPVLSLAGKALDARLTARLRLELGITYDVSMRGSFGRARWPLYVETAVDIEHAAEATDEIVKAVERLNKELLKEEVVAEGRAAVADFADNFESVNDSAATLAHLAVYGLPLDYYSRRADALAKVTPADVRAAFNRHLPLERMKIVIVGDMGTLLPQLEKLKLGTIQAHKTFRLK